MLRLSDLKPIDDQNSIYRPWMMDIVSGSGVRCMSSSDISKHEDLVSGKRIWLNELVLLMYGSLADGAKAIWFINLEACEKSLMEGAHYVKVIGHEPMWVKSLHTWRRQAFNITDLLSFERSVFAIIPSVQRLIRIKTIRSWCELPATNPPIWRQASYISRRTENQLESYMDRLITSYMRDGQTNDVERVVEHIKCHTIMYLCKTLRVYYGKPNYSDFVEDLISMRSLQMDMGVDIKNCSAQDALDTTKMFYYSGPANQDQDSFEHEDKKIKIDRDCERQKLVPIPHEDSRASTWGVQGACAWQGQDRSYPAQNTSSDCDSKPPGEITHF